MTDSAKQAASEASVEPAEPEATAATDAADEAKPEPGEAKPDIDEVKRKFREALDRKHQAHAENSGQGSHEPGKIHGAHGPAGGRRSFRRKSG